MYTAAVVFNLSMDIGKGDSFINSTNSNTSGHTHGLGLEDALSISELVTASHSLKEVVNYLRETQRHSNISSIDGNNSSSSKCNFVS